MRGFLGACGLAPLAVYLFTCVAAAAEEPPPTSVETPETTAIDPDLAAAISADAPKHREAQRPLTLPDSAAKEPVKMQSMNPDISVVADFVAGWTSRDDHIRQGGHSPDENGFTLQGLELVIGGSVDPYFRYDMNFQLVSLELEEAALSTLSLPWNLQFRAGKLISKFGRQNARHLHAWSFVNPSLSHTRFMGEDYLGGLGIEGSALLPLPWYCLIVANVLDSKPGEVALGLASSSFGNRGSLHDPGQLVYVGRLENYFDLSPNWGFDFGLNGAWGLSPYNAQGRSNLRADLYGADLFFKWHPVGEGQGDMSLGLTAEYLFRNTRIPGGTLRDHGGYAQLDVQFMKVWMWSLRGDYDDLVSGTAPDPESLPSCESSPRPERMPGRQWRGSTAFAYSPTHFSKLKLQYDAGKQEGAKGVTHAGYLQFEITIGEHGAHTY